MTAMTAAILRLLVCVLFTAASLSRAQDAAPALFQRIVLLGASATAGFEESELMGGPKTAQYRFANYVEEVPAIGENAEDMQFLDTRTTVQKTPISFLQELCVKKQVTPIYELLASEGQVG